MEKERVKNIFVLWLVWQFYEVPVFLLQVWRNYLMFASNFFSFPLLLKTFFAPWRRYSWSYPKRFDVAEFFNTLISNSFSRILGAMMRIVLVVMGVILQVAVGLAGLVIFIGWFLVPLVVIFGIIFVIS